jgi:hypothetical protein
MPITSIRTPVKEVMLRPIMIFGNAEKSGMYGIANIDQIMKRIPHITRIHPAFARTAFIRWDP